MVSPPVVTIHRVEVIFNGLTKGLTLAYVGEQNHEITIPQGVGIIHFYLKTVDTIHPQVKATFPSSPLQWLAADASPAMQPQYFVSQWIDVDQCQMVVFNAVSCKSWQRFNVLVLYQDQIYGSDPTIICDPPMG